jgi:hypothetical protein
MKPMMNTQAQKYVGIFGKAVVLVLLAAMVLIGFMGAAYRHSGVAHAVFGKTDTSNPLFFDPDAISVIPESAKNERQADGTCGCPYCCSVSES